MTTARDLMTVDPVSILETDTLVVAARTMRDRAVFSLPVCAEGHRLTGVITDRDIVVGCVADGADPWTTTAGQLDGTPVVLAADGGIEEALQLMASRRVRRLPVVDESGRLVGDLHEAAVAIALPGLAIAQARRTRV